MAINLADVPSAVKTYLDTKVTVGVSAFTPATGDTINPNEKFTFKVEVKNALVGGVTLTNVKYRIAVVNPAVPAVATIQVPAGGNFNQPIGVTLVAGTFVDGFIYTPAAGLNSSLGVGDVDNLPLTGKAGIGGGGGTTKINARILADVDLNQLFPKGQDSTSATRDLTVVG